MRTRRRKIAGIDLFDEDEDEGEGGGEAASTPLLRQVHARIRDLVPLREHPQLAVAESDRSIVFHIAHGPVRELEVLHDQLLALLAHPPGGRPLHPRDIVVMVPAIDDFAPAIRAVFGQYGRHDPRHIPFDIADLSARAASPLVSALEWLLRLPGERVRLSELCDLLEVPAIAARFGIDADALPRLTQWMRGAGIRWGLDAAHRAALQLAACGEQNSARFGVNRMLMGYAVGVPGADEPFAVVEPFADIEPYGEVGGLDAELAGGFARLLECLLRWRDAARQPAPPDEWARRCRALLEISGYRAAFSRRDLSGTERLHGGILLGRIAERHHHRGRESYLYGPEPELPRRWHLVRNGRGPLPAPRRHQQQRHRRGGAP